MDTKDPRTLLPAPTLRPGDVPMPLYVGLAVAVVGFFVSLSSLATSNIGGVQTCAYQDYGAMIAAVVCLLCAGLGIHRRTTQQVRYPVQRWVVYLLAGVLVIAAVVHALRGFGIIGGPC